MFYLFLQQHSSFSDIPCFQYIGAQKNGPCAKKGIKTYLLKLYIFVEKLNMIDFNYLKCLNSNLLVNLVLSLSQNSFVNVRFQHNSIFFLVFYFDFLFEDWPVVCLLYFVLSLLDTLFYSLP